MAQGEDPEFKLQYHKKEKKKREIWTHTQRKTPCEDGAVVKIIHLQAKKHQGLPVTLRNWERGMEQILLLIFKRN
jgi:hypothetical protein